MLLLSMTDNEGIMGPVNDTADYLTLHEAMEVLQIARPTVYLWCKKGILKPYTRPAYPRKKLFLKDDIRDLLTIRPKGEE